VNRKGNIIFALLVIALLYAAAFYFEDAFLLCLTFSMVQIVVVLVSIFLVTIHFIKKNPDSRAVLFFATLQFCLALTDIALLIFNHRLIREALLVFLGLNVMFGYALLANTFKKKIT